jgi:hypothetical protein
MGTLPVNPDFPYREFGWLFGLEADKRLTVETTVLTIRPMSLDEAAYIRDQSQHFLLNETIWDNSINRFPYVYERRSIGKSLSTGPPSCRSAVAVRRG